MQQPPNEFIEWYNSLKIIKRNNGPANGTIGTALVVLNRLTDNYNLNFSDHLSDGGMQIRGASGSAVAAILKTFGETRPFNTEGGRTNRGAPTPIKALLETLKKLSLENLPEDERREKIISMQYFLVERVRDYHNRQKIKFHYNPNFSTWHIIQNLLQTAASQDKAGFVAQHLVGAKLQLRFPHINVSNESASTADMPTQRSGDFLIGNTAIHVTVAPMPAVYEKCQQNILHGYKPMLLVPDNKLQGARQNAEQTSDKQIAVESIESFVSQNINEISNYDKAQLTSTIKDLIEMYNKRVDAVETDKSLMIELPSNFR